MFELRVTRPELYGGVGDPAGRQGHYFNTGQFDKRGCAEDPAVFGRLVIEAQEAFPGEALTVQLWQDSGELFADFFNKVLHYNAEGKLEKITNAQVAVPA